MAEKKRESMSSVDVAWLRMDRPSNRMVICGVLLLRERVTVAALRNTLHSRFLRFDRFRQRPVATLKGFEWQSDEHFDLGRHIERIALRPGAGDEELEALVSRLVGKPLDPDQPLWQFHLVDGHRGGTALILRIHHCYADGIALIQVLLSMTDADRDPRRGPAHPPRPRSRDAEDDPLAQIIAPLAGALEMATKAGSTLLDKGAELLRDPAKA